MSNPDKHKAPGRLETLRSFLNSVDLEKGGDAFLSVDGVGDWCRQAGLGPCESADPADLRAFREALRGLLFANNGQCDRGTAWREVEPFARRAQLQVQVDGNGLRLDPSGRGNERIIGALLTVLYDAIAAQTWPRLKACRKDSCRWVFYDSSKNGSGAWCSMAVCGNQMKAQRRRAREKSA